MKKHVLKSVFAAMLVAAMAFSMTACGDKPADATGDAAGDAAASAPAALTVDEYKGEFETLQTSMTDLQSSATSASTPEDAKKLLEDMKASFQKFADVTPPDELKDAHAKLKSGCEAMITYIDTSLQMMDETDATKLGELTQTATDALQTAMADMTEGATLADGVLS